MPEPTPFGRNLERRYGIWYQSHPTTYVNGVEKQSNAGDFMRATFPDKYQGRSRDTARRAYNKITAGETSGRNVSYYQPKKYVVPKSYKKFPPKPIKGEFEYRVDVYFYNNEEAYKLAVATDGEDNRYSTSRRFNMVGHRELGSRGPDWILVQELTDQKITEWSERVTCTDLTEFQWYRIEVTRVPAIWKTAGVIELDDYDLG